MKHLMMRCVIMMINVYKIVIKEFLLRITFKTKYPNYLKIHTNEIIIYRSIIFYDNRSC